MNFLFKTPSCDKNNAISLLFLIKWHRQKAQRRKLCVGSGNVWRTRKWNVELKVEDFDGWSFYTHTVATRFHFQQINLCVFCAAATTTAADVFVPFLFSFSLCFSSLRLMPCGFCSLLLFSCCFASVIRNNTIYRCSEYFHFVFSTWTSETVGHTART